MEGNESSITGVLRFIQALSPLQVIHLDSNWHQHSLGPRGAVSSERAAL